MVVIDLFSGAGGLTEGFIREGYRVVAHVEKEKWACETLKTRICYHYLKAKNDLDLYFRYLRNSNDYRNLGRDREIIFEKYPELREKLEIEVLNKTFGKPRLENGTTSSAQIIGLIERSMRYNNVRNADIIIGGPPCQAYSLIGRGRMKDSVKDDKRNFLFRYYKDIVNHFKPKMFVFENVPGILNANNGEIFKSIRSSFAHIGYTLLSGPNNDHQDNILDSSDFGVYQSRKRMILIGFRKSEFPFGAVYPNFSNHYITSFTEEKSTRNAIGDLPDLTPGIGNDYYYGNYNKMENLSEYQKLMRQESNGVLNHKARPHLDRDIRNYTRAIGLASHGSKLKYRDIPAEDSTHKNKTDFEDRFKVHWWDEVPHTIVAHISKDGHYNIHPDIEQCRSLTVREAARIQSFPDNFKFEGPRTWQFTQVGNAVPPLMAQAIARAIKEECLNQGKYDQRVDEVG